MSTIGSLGLAETEPSSPLSDSRTAQYGTLLHTIPNLILKHNTILSGMSLSTHNCGHGHSNRFNSAECVQLYPQAMMQLVYPVPVGTSALTKCAGRSSYITVTLPSPSLSPAQ
jgi:hypothetical protein